MRTVGDTTFHIATLFNNIRTFEFFLLKTVRIFLRIDYVCAAVIEQSARLSSSFPSVCTNWLEVFFGIHFSIIWMFFSVRCFWSLGDSCCTFFVQFFVCFLVLKFLILILLSSEFNYFAWSAFKCLYLFNWWKFVYSHCSDSIDQSRVIAISSESV